MFRWTMATGWLILSAMPALALVSNGFDSDNIYVLQGGANQPTNMLYYHSKLTPTLVAPDNWASLNTSIGMAVTGDFVATALTSLTFSYSQTPGVNTPAGYRLFYLGKDTDGTVAGNPVLQEVDSENNILREVYIGRIVNGNADFGGATTIGSWPHVNLRYNAKNNTLMVGISHNGIGTGGILHAYIYEFSLPDSPAGTGVGSPDELQGCTLMETYDTGVTGTNAGGGLDINVTPNGAVYWRNQLTNLLAFGSTAGGYAPGGTTTGPTTVLTNAALNAATLALGMTKIGTDGQWQSAIYRPASKSLVNLQRKVNTGGPPYPLIMNYDPTSIPPLVVIGGTTGGFTSTDAVRGQEHGVLDPGTGDIWFVGQAFPASANGGTWKYSADGVLTKWDNLDAAAGGLQLFDIAIPPAGSGACCKPAGGGCEILAQADCTVASGVWQGAGTICEASACVEGSCCLAGHNCASKTQVDCLVAGGFWQGPGTTCGQFPCPEGACCGGCGKCQQTLPSECTGNKIWRGPFTTCGEVACPELCGTPAADADCDGDVDQADFALFQACLAVDLAVQTPCACFDLTDVTGQGPPDNVIDEKDLAKFEVCASGPGLLAIPACAN